MFKIIGGNLLDATEKFVAHQCNCISRGSAAGVARHIFDKWPWANVYIQRKDWPEKQIAMAGTAQICGDGKDQRYVVALYGQVYPGFPNPPQDGTEMRQQRFKHSLESFLGLSPAKELVSVAFPWKIGCGLAGGDWTVYQAMLEDFAKKVDANVVVYKPEWEK